SDFSDGDWSPETVAKKAKQAGLKGVVLTDHNTINGSEEALAACKKMDILSFEGIEISCAYKTIDIHMVGMARQFKRDILSAGLKSVVAGNNGRVKQMTGKINALKQFPIIDYNALLQKKGPGSALMKYDILREIKKLQPGFIPSQLTPLLQRGGKTYVPYGDWAMHPTDAVELIHKAGGIAVLAHPGAVERSGHDKLTTEKYVDELILDLVKKGLDGIEARYSKYSPEQEQKFLNTAGQLGLLVSGGSDWHGEYHHPEIELGSAGVMETEFQKITDKIDQQS
ncbi:MAG: PHP domain-containing protein, partial [bacterium]|nr:PHP domain-containing protein [bacterium]